MLNRNTISFHIKGVSSLWVTQLFLGALLLAGFPSDGGGASANKNQEPASTELNFLNSSPFDSQLSSALAAKPPAVTVKVIAPFTANNIPERMDKWLNAVHQYGGKVELKPDPDYPASRDVGSIISWLKKVFELAKEHLLYRNAENYNVEVLYKPGSGEVTRVVFTLKEGVKQ